MNTIKIENLILLINSYRLITYKKNDNTEERFLEEDSLWGSLNKSKNLNDIENWVKEVRKYLWGSEKDFLSFRENFSLEEEQYYKRELKSFLGSWDLCNIVLKNKGLNDFINKYQNINYNQDIYLKDIFINDQKREMLFTHNNELIDVDYKKVNDDILLKLANKICSEFNFYAISFSYNINQVDVLKYLLEVAYGLERFSHIIKTKNIGAGKLILSFEEKGINKSCYNLNYNTIHFNVNDSFGVFAHEWFHFIDHLAINKYPLSDDGNNLFTMIKPNKKNKKLFDFHNEMKKNLTFNDEDFIRAIGSMKIMLRSLPTMLHDFTKKYHEEVPVIKSILLDLDMFILNAEKIIEKSDKIKTFWNNWKKETFYRIKNSELIRNKEFISFWNFYIIFVEKVCFDKYRVSKNPYWVIYSKMQDEFNHNIYLSRYDELMARSFELYIFHKMKKKSWISYKKNYDLSYPRELELENEISWWDKNLKNLLIETL